MTTAVRFDMHASAMGHAISIYPLHVVTDDGELCFNLHSFLDDLEQAIDAELNKPDSPCGAFRLNAEAIARYTWCCFALQGGDRPDGDTFRGMPILTNPYRAGAGDRTRLEPTVPETVSMMEVTYDELRVHLDTQTGFVADTIRDVAVKMDRAISEGYRSAKVDAHDIIEILLAIADGLDAPRPVE